MSRIASSRSSHGVQFLAATLLRVSGEGFGTTLVLLVQARTGQAAGTGFLLAACLLPYVVAGPVVGNILDRTTRPAPVAAAFAASYAVAVALLLTVAGRVPLGIALPAAVAVGCFEPIVMAMTSLLPRIVASDRLPKAYGLESASYNLAGIVGPALAAGVASVWGPENAAVILVCVALTGAVTMTLLRLPEKRPSDAPGDAERPGPAGWDVLTGGLTVLLGNRSLRALTAGTTVGFLGMGGIPVVAVLLAQHLGAGVTQGGRLLAVYAIGALIGSLSSTRGLPERRVEWVVVGGMALFGALLAGCGAAPGLDTATVLFGLTGIVDGPVLAATLTLRQREAPPDRLGQVNTTGGSMKIAAAAVGAALTSAFAGRLGAPGMLFVMGTLQGCGALLAGILLSPWRPWRSG